MTDAFVQLPYPNQAQLDSASGGTLIIQHAIDGSGNFYPQGLNLQAGGRWRTVLVGSTSPDSTGYPATVSMPTWAANSRYVGAMTNSSYRWKLVADARRAWRDWPTRPDGFYIGHEASMALWAGYSWSESVRAGYEAVLLQHIRDAWAEAPYRPLVWSPYIWERYSQVTAARRNEVAEAIVRTLTVVRDWARERDDIDTPGITLLLQDGVGAGAPRGVTKEDALGWVRLIESHGYPVSLNVESFVASGSGFIPAPD